ncbi:OmpP1/FadL family transporter [Enhygromyxa salina]|uniref:Outer membrane protein transport protein n=1 Tax=Enhygromyxa salina TaxID=215803 RepID=A0A2S9XTK9_9BACT|nr:outer membrane protein transport protein [Enhygromyxa salina]PRP96195.1 Outer membrane protein transport protein [Enhygromyxa salina]
MSTPRFSATPRLGLSAPLAAALAGLLGVGLWSSSAEASGIGTARFGGEHGHPTGTNATTIYYNPGAIALSKGTHIFVDGLIALRKVQYTRPDSAVNPQPGAMGPNVSLDYANGANNGTANLFNVAGAPFLGATSDFGTDFIYGGAAVYVPFGGGAAWGKNDQFKDDPDFPGAYDGVQRWYAIDGNLRSFYITGALAFKIKAAANLTLGFSGSAIYSSIDTVRARNADGTDNLVSGTDPDNFRLKEGRSWLKAGGWQGGFAAGFTVEPVKDVFWIGGSYTSQPNVTGGMALKGELTNIFTTGESAVTNVEVTQTYPDIVRLGFRVRPIPKLELRVFADYTRWSVFDKQCVLIVKEDPSNADTRKCDFPNADTALEDPSNFGAGDENVVDVTQHLPRFWKDAGGVRVGVGYWFIDELETYIGLGYDSSAIPAQTVDPVLFDMDKIAVTLGALWQAHEHVAVGATVGQIIYLTLDTKGQNVFNEFQPPTRQASADGIYKQWLTIGNLYLDISF